MLTLTRAVAVVKVHQKPRSNNSACKASIYSTHAGGIYSRNTFAISNRQSESMRSRGRISKLKALERSSFKPFVISYSELRWTVCWMMKICEIEKLLHGGEMFGRQLLSRNIDFHDQFWIGWMMRWCGGQMFYSVIHWAGAEEIEWLKLIYNVISWELRRLDQQKPICLQ